MTTDFHTKHRPVTWDEVVGQRAVVRSLQKLLAAGTGHAFLFHGDSGTGKTTVARIIAREIGCEPHNLREINAAVNTGVDAMRDITETLRYAALGKSKTRVLIVDEAHRLSAQAWDSLLKDVEEPPRGVYWVFCSTEPNKIPKTIRNRCQVYGFAAVDKDELIALLRKVTKAEELSTPQEVLEFIVDQSAGSPRRALTYLAQVSECETRKQAAQVLQAIEDEDDRVIELCRELVAGGQWNKVVALCAEMKETNAESIRIIVFNYVTVCLLKSGKGAKRFLALLDAFSDPYPSQAKIGYVLLSAGAYLFGGGEE